MLLFHLQVQMTRFTVTIELIIDALAAAEQTFYKKVSTANELKEKVHRRVRLLHPSLHKSLIWVNIACYPFLTN